MANYVRISVSIETKNKFKDCYTEFLEARPEFKGMFLSEDFILNKIIDYYLEL